MYKTKLRQSFEIYKQYCNYDYSDLLQELMDEIQLHVLRRDEEKIHETMNLLNEMISYRVEK